MAPSFAAPLAVHHRLLPSSLLPSLTLSLLFRKKREEDILFSLISIKIEFLTSRLLLSTMGYIDKIIDDDNVDDDVDNKSYVA